MTTYIILLRGVMPTGKNKVLMAPLREALERAGLSGVRTYIQSGNVIADSALNPPDLETLVHEVIAGTTGGDIKVLARPAAYFKRALARCPFRDADTTKLYFTLLEREPGTEQLGALLESPYAPDALEIRGDMAYILFATRYSDSKLNNAFLERKLKLAATTRVYRTIAKLVELSKV